MSKVLIDITQVCLLIVLKSPVVSPKGLRVLTMRHSFLFCFNSFYFILFGLHVCLCEGIRSPGTEVTDSCDLPGGCWELNLDPRAEWPVLSTAEPSLQPLSET